MHSYKQNKKEKNLEIFCDACKLVMHACPFLVSCINVQELVFLNLWLGLRKKAHKSEHIQAEM